MLIASESEHFNQFLFGGDGEIVSSIIHHQHGEMDPLPQNAVLALAAIVLIYLAGFRNPRTPIQPTN